MPAAAHHVDLPDVEVETVRATAARLSAWDATAWDRHVLLEEDESVELHLAHRHDDVPFVARIEASCGHAPRMTILGAPKDVERSWACEAVRSLADRLGWKDDLDAFWRGVDDDPALEAALRPLVHLRLVRHPTPFEALAWALIRQRTPHAFAVASLARLQTALGSSVQVGSRRWCVFPPAHVVAADEARAAILHATRNVRKTDRLHAASQQFATSNDDAIAHGPLDEAKKILGRLAGVGAWTVDYVLLMGYGRLDHVPWTDTGLARALSSIYAEGWTLDARALHSLAVHHHGFGGMWAHMAKRSQHGMGGY